MNTRHRGAMVGDAIGELSGRLLVQCRPEQVKNAARVASAHGTGLVLTARQPGPAVAALRAHGFAGPILCDANRYSGRRRSAACCGVREGWIAEQHRLGLTPLTDSGYLAEHDWPGLRRILSDAAGQPGQVIATLPLAARWLEHSVDGLVAELDSFGVPVAVAIEHARDPFAVGYLIRGFLALLEASVPVILLRSDVSALGALCHGVHAAAVGTSAGLRHVFPRTGRLVPRPGSLTTFLPPLLGHHPLAAIDRLAAGLPDETWRCDCQECAGRSLPALAATPHPDASAFRHSLAAQLTMWSALREHPRPVTAWHQRCSDALAAHRTLGATQPEWHPPTNLHGWFQATRTSPPLRN